MDKTRRFIVLNAREHFEKGLLHGLTIHDDMLIPKGEESLFYGAFYSAAIDSHERGFQWGRAQILGDFSKDLFQRFSCYASDTRMLDENEPDIDAYLTSPYQNTATKASALDRLYTELHAGERDFSVRAKGRYLFVRLELMGAGFSTARLRAIRLQIQGDHMMDYLPAMYRRGSEQDFIYRFLSIFNSITLDLEERIMLIRRLFDFEQAEGEMLRYLAQWVNVSGVEDEAALRDAIRDVVREQAILQTPRGISRFIEKATGYRPILLEHFNFAEVLKEGKDRALYEKLYGENPFRLTVMLPETAFVTRAQQEDFLENLHAVLPAHVEARLLTLSEGVYLDRYTYLGTNTRLAGYRTLKVDDSVSLDYNTIVGQ